MTTSNKSDITLDSLLSAPDNRNNDIRPPKSLVDEPPKGGQNHPSQPYSANPNNLESLDKEADIANKKNDTALRKNLSEFSMLVTVVSLSIWGGVIFFQILGKMQSIEVFSDIQFATITTGCTVNILTVILGVIKGMFK